MKADLTLKLGNKILKIAGEGTETSIMKALNFWTQLPEVCSCCKSQNIGLTYRRAKEKFDYYGLRCNSCGAELTFHQKMDSGAFYITKDDVFKKYDASNAIEDKTDNRNTPPINDEGIPF